jgi:HlyD family secretion protein
MQWAARAMMIGLALVCAADAMMAQSPANAPPQRLVAAPGLVEPIGEEREIGSQVIGVVREMRVEENDSVAADQVIAVIDNNEQVAGLASARAQLALRESELTRVVTGARPEERRQAKAELAEADANLDLARRDFERRSPLTASGASTQAALDLSTFTLHGAEARRAAAAERLGLIEAGARAEDIESARAQVHLAEANVALAEALLGKTFIRSPIAGVVLRRYIVAGQAVGNMPPTPIAVVGDLSRLRVRAEVDETDVGRVAPGQRVEVSADAYPGRTFGGAVFRVAARLGGKAVQTGRPAEKVDTKVLQVLIDLDSGSNLPIGLRVDVYFLGPAPAATARGEGK